MIAIALCNNKGLPSPDIGLANYQLCSLTAFINNCTSGRDVQRVRNIYSAVNRDGKALATGSSGAIAFIATAKTVRTYMNLVETFRRNVSTRVCPKICVHCHITSGRQW
ncbi:MULTISPECIES: hypothetical protein [unclassified Coleofasciculus]|uniref:hypothetical protein n=1 Tax=unclassified Coleofasciculus TaxID=2692782 RepID=UPI001882C069|nr:MULTISPECIES: hypothetical protein [unclassified Coleofasciculus]MBE9126061.1 hypothetical protein [Coleofasciculus sp. LEGE 07081]MBE9149474.1 hypothetical protein [Coleofasciculus sp. LEGE 07092]